MKKSKTASVVTIVIITAILFVIALPILAAAAGELDASGEAVTASLKELASGSMGKAIFGICLLIGFVCVMSRHTRTLGLAALAVGVLLGAYSGLLEGLWSMFKTSAQ